MGTDAQAATAVIVGWCVKAAMMKVVGVKMEMVVTAMSTGEITLA